MFLSKDDCLSALYEWRNNSYKETITSTYLAMVSKKKNKDFKDLDQYPDLKEALVPSVETLPPGSMNTKVIINEGEIVEKVYVTPKGESISLFENEYSQRNA